LATREDIAALTALMDAAISELQKPFLNNEQIASSRTFMGLDTQLIDDGTYFIVEQEGVLVGCGGWSRRATLYGGDRSPGRDAALLEPTMDAARLRAMFTHPSFIRRGVGRLILALCEDAARAANFTRVELMACQSALDWDPRSASKRGSDAISMMLQNFHGTPINRACSRSILARPYI
jgi:GNAT superfamily N-acetyltransferase